MLSTEHQVKEQRDVEREGDGLKKNGKDPTSTYG